MLLAVDLAPYSRDTLTKVRIIYRVQMPRYQKVLVAFLTLALWSMGSIAQSIAQEANQTATPQITSGDKTEGEQGNAIKPKTLPPAYEDQMLRLAETLGSLHYLRALCGAEEGQTWREEMQKLLDAEEPSPSRRAQLIARFNHGFRGYAEIYRECTKPALEASNQFLKLGMRISAEIPNRFGR